MPAILPSTLIVNHTGKQGLWHQLPSQAEWEMLARWLVGAGMSGHKGVSLVS